MMNPKKNILKKPPLEDESFFRKDYLQKDHHLIIPQNPAAMAADKPCQYQVATQGPQEQKARSTKHPAPPRSER